MLFEIIVDVAEQIKNHFRKFSSEDYILTALNIYSEKDNKSPLFWHTDSNFKICNREGMLRAIIYLKGGEDNSGMFMYMMGTHNMDHSIEHKLSESQINQLNDRIMDCKAPAGSLFVFDTKGFHARKMCLKERRVLFLEFNPKNKNHGKERILLPSNHLTEKVILNINMFANSYFSSEDLGVHGHEPYLLNHHPLPLKASFFEFIKSLYFESKRFFAFYISKFPFLKKALLKFK